MCDVYMNIHENIILQTGENVRSSTKSTGLISSFAHKASTKTLHPLLSAAALSIDPQVQPCSFISFSTVRLQVSLGLPGTLFPSGVQRKAILVRDEGSLRSTCQRHVHLLILIIRVIRAGGCPSIHYAVSGLLRQMYAKYLPETLPLECIKTTHQ